MSRGTRELAHLLAEHGARLPMEIEGLTRDLRGALASVEVKSAGECFVHTGRSGRLIGTVGPETRRAIGQRPGALWVVDVPALEGVGTAAPFAPPHSAHLDGPLPVRVPESLQERLTELKLDLGLDLTRVGAVRVVERCLAVLGMRTLAALDEADAERITWWLPNGAALELRLVTDIDHAWLHLVDLVPARDRDAAHSGPTALLELGEGAKVELTPAESEARGEVRWAAGLRPPRSQLMDAWARYGAAEQQVNADRQAKRQGHPIDYEEAHQSHKGWRARARLSAEAMSAWAGAGAREGRRVRVSQPVGLKGEGTEAGGFTLESLTVLGPNLVSLALTNQRGTSRLPPTGRLELRRDYGLEIKQRRERQALERLSSGRAACPRLHSLLRRPGDATPPRLAPLRTSPHESLDPDQLRAVQLILGCIDIVAVQGPPGTGKTRVIAEALRQLAVDRGNRSAPVRILVSSVQNEAVANVADRLAAGAEGMVVRVVQRESRDEDESLEFARTLDQKRAVCIEHLRSQLQGFDFQPQLDELEEVGRAVDAVRASATSHDVAGTRQRLADLLERHSEALSSLLVHEAPTLCRVLLEGDKLAAEESPSAPSSSRPSDPESVAGWWSEAKSGLDPADSAELGFLTERVVSALALPDSTRRARRVERSWNALQEALDEVSNETARTVRSAPVPAPESGEIFKRIDAWCVQARTELSDAEAQILRRPQAIAHRFLRALEANPKAWQRIVENHGGTVAATCSMAAKAELPPGEHYDWVIIDEAGRASPFELLVPMVQGARVVLIGDHRQLPPMIDRDIVAKANSDISADLDQETLFGQLFHLLPAGCKVRLSTQYRMHGAIGAIVDQVFYRPHGEGLASWFSGERADSRLSRLGVFDDQPLAWLDVAPGQKRCTEENRREAEAIVEVVRSYAQCGAPPGHVAVIAPYQKQRKLLERLLKADPDTARVAQVKTIDAVQGREYPVVILGLTRTDGGPGFLASPNRINVAVSRAQQQLVVVGTRSRFLTSQRVRRRASHVARLIELLEPHEVSL